jgi:hypothetical protein
MDAGTAKVYLNTQAIEGWDIVIKSCSLVKWRRIRSSKTTRWLCTHHMRMRGFAGGFDFAR